MVRHFLGIVFRKLGQHLDKDTLFVTRVGANYVENGSTL